MEKFFFCAMAASLIFGGVNGRMDMVSAAALEESSHAVELSIKLLGSLCFWSGILSVAEKSGIVDSLRNILMPVLKFIFPRLKNEKKAMGAISMNVASNLLGLGNAATPLGISAMKELHRITEIIKGIPRTAVITDGRFSGASGGLSIGYLCPEAQEGGPIALVHDGDEIFVDLYQGMIRLEISDEELEQRRQQWKAPEFTQEKGLLSRYAQMVGSARQGATFYR